MEVWKAIPGYEGYEASNTGKIRSLNFSGKAGYVKELATRTRHDSKHFGYVQIRLRGKDCSVHRLVAMTFLPEWDKELEVDHINGIRDDNRVENLRMCTHRDNNLGEGFYGAKDRQYNSGVAGKKATAKVVHQYTLDGTYITSYESLRDAARITSITWQNISDCARGIQKSSGGFYWTYARKEVEKENPIF